MKNSFSKKSLIPIFLFLFNFVSAQDASFLAPDTVCQNEILELEYTGSGGESFCWISSPVFGEIPYLNDVFEFPNGKKPHFTDVIKEDGNYYMFTGFTNEIDGSNGKLMRLDFGNSLNNIPSSTILNIDVISYGQEGVQIIKSGNQWWGFLIGLGHLVRLDFGTEITNIPSVEDLGNIGNLSFPHDLFIYNETNQWLGLFIDRVNNSLNRLTFGNELSNMPTVEVIPNNFLDNPTGFFPISVEGNWYLFIVNTEGNSITRFDFGNSLFNNPVENDLGDLGILNEPRDLSIFYACNQYCGFLLNKGDSTLIKLDFSSDIENTPSIFTVSNQEILNFPHSITEGYFTESALHFFFTNVESNDLKELVFPINSSNPVQCRDNSNPPEISFDSSGIHSLFLITDEGIPTQSSDCKQIFVLPTPNLNIGNDTTVCVGSTLILESNSENTVWGNGNIGATISVNEGGIIEAELSNENCTTYDSIEVDFINCEDCFLVPNVFTPDGDNLNDEFKPILECENLIEKYSLQIYNRWGNNVFETSNLMEGWDGKFNNNPSPSDVFVWKIFYTVNFDGQVLERTISGDVTLIR
ncbi:MAG: gliding motility-associated C-terminal domain-containing protein [Saprospiraceae bacterium]